MSNPESRKFNQSFPEYKAEQGIEYDPDGMELEVAYY